jgi:ABC-type transport system involved in multi-copper enzyme maturation permease subunit
MIGTLILKELESILLSPKFVATFLVCSALMLLSVFMGIREYHASVAQYETASELVRQEMREARGWMMLNDRVYRSPDPMQIFAAGVDNDIGRYSAISTWEPVKLVHSAYSDDPIFALFRFMDFAFIVSVVLTLFAIVFTYDAVSGERERGTLQLVFSNAVRRTHYVAAKFAGAWLGLVLPLTVPILLSILLLPLLGVPMTGEFWARLGMLIGVSLLLLSFFTAFGVFVSTLTRHSSVSFLVALVCWVMFVLILPRASVMIAGQILRVPSVAQTESLQDQYARDRWDEHMRERSNLWREREASLSGLPERQREARREEMEWVWAEEDDTARKDLQRQINDHARKLTEETRNTKRAQEQLAFTLSRFSPVSAYQLAVMNLAATDIALKTRTEDALQAYRNVFSEYKDRKQKESGSTGGIRITVDTDRGVKIDTGREIALDLSDAPRYEVLQSSFAGAAASAMIDVGILGAGSLLMVALSFGRFLRYDVR